MQCSTIFEEPSHRPYLEKEQSELSIVCCVWRDCSIEGRMHAWISSISPWPLFGLDMKCHYEKVYCDSRYYFLIWTNSIRLARWIVLIAMIGENWDWSIPITHICNTAFLERPNDNLRFLQSSFHINWYWSIALASYVYKSTHLLGYQMYSVLQY